jgi:tetratricopeptide (TPR) repeat protein
LGIVWVLYQISGARRLSQSEVEEWIEGHLDEKPSDLMKERKEYLARLNDYEHCPVGVRAFRALLAHLRMMAASIVRILLLRRRRMAPSHALLLLTSGNAPRARAELEEMATSYEKMVNIYEKQVRAKKIEACNAYLYAGRVASQRGDSESARRAFDNVLRIDGKDTDAHKLIGRQYLDSKNIGAALAEFSSMESLAKQKSDKSLEAESYRLQAEAHLLDGRTGRAHRSLRRSAQVLVANDYPGFGHTQEMLGDVFAQQNRVDAAENSYTASSHSWGLAGDNEAAARVQKKLKALRSADTWISKALEYSGQFMLKLAKQTRDRAQRK